MKGCSIMLEIIPQHQNCNDVRRDPLYIHIKKRTNDDVLNILEQVADQLERRFKNPHPVVASSANDDGDMDDAMKRYPPVEDLSLDDLPAVPTAAPRAVHATHPKMNMPEPHPVHPPHPHPSPSNNIDNNINNSNSTSSLPLPPPQPRRSPPAVPQPPPSSSPSPPVLQIKQRPPSPENPLKLPPLTNFQFPPSLTVSPKDLVKWITMRENPPSILLLDVRPRDMYQRGCIKHKWICQIEPLVLRKDVSSKKIQESLVLNPDAEQHIFSERQYFDLVVYYDQDSQHIQTANEPLKHLKNAIFENEFQKSLSKIPMMLSGGFSAWYALVGEAGTYRFIDTKTQSVSKDESKGHTEKQTQHPHQQQQPQPQKPKGHWLRDVVGKGPNDHHQAAARNSPPVHHTLYDYFNYRQPSDSPTRPSATQAGVTPPLQGVFAHSLNTQGLPNNGSMPMPTAATPALYQPSSSTTPSSSPSTPSEESIVTRYPDIRPNSTYESNKTEAIAALQRRNTFIDNPFHGFTSTSTNLYDTPPVPAKPTRPLPPPPPPRHSPGSVADLPQPPPPAPPHASSNAPPLPSKPGNLMVSHQHNGHAPVSDSSFSQLGAVMIGTTGLKNLGNTCYMNSIVQCLSGTIPLARYLISGTFKHHLNKNNPLGTGGVLVDSFATLLRIMWSESYNFISPVTFREALTRFAPQFSGTQQQDSQEFLNFLLDGIHEDVNLVHKRPPPPKDDPEEEARFEKLPDWQARSIAWERYLARNASIIVSLFQGQYRSRLTCLTCHQTSTTYNTFMSLSLPIPARGSTPPKVTLYQCLDYFVREETLDGDDAWHCPRCKKLRRASKALTLSRLPDVLLIHLKRFSYDGPFHNKLETLVQYPTRALDLSPYVPDSMFPPNIKERPSFKYDLYGVSNHYGSLTGGHYTACVRNGYRGEWHYFDDTRFSVCDETKVMSRAAYNLFYVRSTVK
ncbi:hypothetical protein BCR43DRAFT_540683 [Syncephalastrum racemosum]|uniref:Ubiquitin carboxyl-terminal hydrolase n=1 Tax=Syncephalastrum racemosum TaxID=13706 RepID=A0A1X2HMG4_SYNRA|nr:hypothetical protein BCR43DRAFT_540683 [Syncephalastrum racemosum]